MNPLMPFVAIEPLNNKVQLSLPNALTVDSTGRRINYKANIIRLLTGTLNIEWVPTSKVIKQRNNYSTINFRKVRLSKKQIESAFPEYDLEVVAKYLDLTQKVNAKFYEELFCELGYYFLQRDGNNELGAFFHLYRVLEQIAYALPLVWAAKAKDYKNTYAQFRNYISDPKTSELKMFQRFVDDIIDEPLRLSTLTLKVTSIDNNWAKAYYKVLDSCISNDYKINANAYTDISLSYSGIIPLVIGLRNRYFHFLTGKGDNYSYRNIPDPNEFFSILNEEVTNWFSVILFEIMIHELKNSYFR